ncbi:MAG: antibiotic biosynthesis monooxygenase family protein [Burkholderiaceae bacterium]
MFAVVFEVRPDPHQGDAYLGYAKMLRPELQQVDGFIDNFRYRSLTRPGWLLSLSTWRDEKSLVRWRTRAVHHDVQEKGRGGVLRDYRLRVGQLVADTRPPAGHGLAEQRLDETEIGAARALVLVDARRDAARLAADAPLDTARSLGLDEMADGLVQWDVFDAVLAPGDAIALTAWCDAAAAEAFQRRVALPADARLRRVRVVRDYGLVDRREAPQYYPEAPARS